MMGAAGKSWHASLQTGITTSANELEPAVPMLIEELPPVSAGRISLDRLPPLAEHATATHAPIANLSHFFIFAIPPRT
jgi:hypothetical protein